MSFCYQLGAKNKEIKKEEKQLMIVNSNFKAGGLVGICNGSEIMSSGVENGIIFSQEESGGISSEMINVGDLSQVYTRPNVSVESNGNVGGISSIFVFNQNNKINISNFYSASKLFAKHKIGGFFASFDLSDETNLLVLNSFDSSFISSNSSSTQIGNIISFFDPCLPKFQNVFFNLTDNRFVNAFGNHQNVSSVLGLPSSQLYFSILSKYNQENLWCSNRLRIEHNFICSN